MNVIHPGLEASNPRCALPRAMSGATVDAALAAVPTTVGDAAAPAPDRVENPLPIVKAPIVALEDWPASDDFLLREAVEAGAALGAIARGILPFSTPRTREDITERWRALLYNETVSLPAARRMAQYALDAKPRVAPLPTTIEFKDAFVNGNGKGTTEGDEMDSSEGKTGGDTTDTTHTNDKTGNRDTKVTTGLVSIPPFALAEAAVFDMPLLPSFTQVDFSAKRKSKQALQGTECTYQVHCIHHIRTVRPDYFPSALWPARLLGPQFPIQYTRTPYIAQHGTDLFLSQKQTGALAKIRKLEASAQAATARNATSVGAVGVLQGNNHRFFLKKRETAVGRNTEDQRVDVVSISQSPHSAD